MEDAVPADCMLKLFHSLNSIHFSKLMHVYSESNRKNADIQFPQEERNLALMQVEQDFYQYLKQCFFTTHGAFYAVWQQSDVYVSALRVEPFQDGMLITGLETAPEHRRCGYAVQLIGAVADILRQQGLHCIYSHVDKQNHPSLKAHLACGFDRVLEHAVYIDGSVVRSACTLQLIL